MKYKKVSAFTIVFSCVLAGGIITVCASNDKIHNADALLTYPTSESELMQTQEEKFEALSKCSTKEEYTELYTTLFPDADMIYLFAEDFPEGTLPYK